jgi:hypothetical protein
VSPVLCAEFCTSRFLWANFGGVEELLIDFCELKGAHTGENMAEAVLKTLKTYGLIGKVNLKLLHYAASILTEKIDYRIGDGQRNK